MNMAIVIVVAPTISHDMHNAELAIVNGTHELSQEIHESGLLEKLENYLTGSASLNNIEEVCFDEPKPGSKVKPVPSSSNLSPREEEVLTLISKGLTQKEIAKNLYLSPNTVGSHRKEIYRKLNISSCAEATVEAIKLGLLNIDYM